MTDFKFELSPEEKKYLKDIAFLSIKSRFDPQIKLPEPPTRRLEEHLGAFVTLKIRGRLRGCIGHITGDRPVWKTVASMAAQSAFNDPRFSPLTEQETGQLELEISILSPLSIVENVDNIIPGKHGLMIIKNDASGLLLPQVASERNWDRETFLANTCFKAGLKGNCWQDPDARIFQFQAEIF
ncbi:MAG: AmmeMemoRadiSam system protein A [Desulfonatronovibrionaceae bacterium]